MGNVTDIGKSSYTGNTSNKRIPVTWGKSVIQVMNSMGTKMNQRNLSNMVDYGNFNNCENINNQSKFCNIGNISD